MPSLMGGRQGLESEEKAMQLLLETEIQVRSQWGKATRSWRAKEADPSSFWEAPRRKQPGSSPDVSPIRLVLDF